MEPPEDLSKSAVGRAEQMLAGRLERNGISTSRPEWYFQCEAGEPEPFPGGWQVRVRTWRHWSDATVHFDAEGGDVLHRCVDRLSDPPAGAEMTKEDALRIAASVIDIPSDARLASFRHEEFAEGRRVARLDWQRFRGELRVDGDYLWVLIHPQTHRLVAFGRKWRPL